MKTDKRILIQSWFALVVFVFSFFATNLAQLPRYLASEPEQAFTFEDGSSMRKRSVDSETPFVLPIENEENEEVFDEKSDEGKEATSNIELFYFAASGLKSTVDQQVQTVASFERLKTGAALVPFYILYHSWKTNLS